MRYSSSAHTRFYHRYHVVWATKYRYRVLQGAMRERIREIIIQTCEELGCPYCERRFGARSYPHVPIDPAQAVPVRCHAAHQGPIIDDISRIARDIRVFFDLRDAIEDAGAFIESPTMRFSQVRSADSNHYEGTQALNAQHFREKNAETNRKRKFGRLVDGYWPYKAPQGYKFKRFKQHGNMPVRDEPQASILQEAFEGYASGFFASQVEVKRFLENHPDFRGKLPNGAIRHQRVIDLMTNPIYAGYVQCEKLGIPLKQGKHDGLISFATFKKMEKRRKELAVAPARKDIHLDFPLRGFVTCGDCDKPLRGCWSKGKTKRYAYYLCQNKDCESYGKSIRQADIEGDFEALLKQMRPNQALTGITKAMLYDAWNQRLSQAEEMKKLLRRQIVKLERQVDGYLEKITEVSSPRVMKAFDRKIDQLEQEKLLASEKLEKSFKSRKSAEEMLELSLRFLANPCKLWQSGNIHLRKLVLRLAFAEPLPYHRIEGYRTPKTTLPFSVLGGATPSECKLVR